MAFTEKSPDYNLAKTVNNKNKSPSNQNDIEKNNFFIEE